MKTTRNGDDELDFPHVGIKFSEVWDPIAAMMWISHMDDVFEAVKCADENKVAYAVSMLRSEAQGWWYRVKATSGGSESPTKMTWSQFKEVFKDQFYPISVELELMEQFKTVKQGNNESVGEFIPRFERLWWFFSHLSYEKRMIYLFVCGLRPDIKDYIPTSAMTTFESMIYAARVIEKENNRRLEERNDRLARECGSV